MNKPKVMLHIIMPNQISGPNSAVKRIKESYLADKYEFPVLTQTFHAGGKVNLRLIRALKKQVTESKPDLIHLTGLQASGFHAIVACRLATRVPILVTIRGFSGDSLAISKVEKFVFSYLIEPITLALSTKFLTVTNAAGRRKMVTRFDRKYLGALHNAAPIWEKNELIGERFESERDRLGINGEFVVTVVGRMVTDKGMPTIVKVAEGLPPGFVICIVGDGPWLDIIQEKYSHLIDSRKILLLGQRSDVSAILSVSDVFLFATLHENLSNALLEAMSLSLPTVVTRVGGNPEVVVHGETGFLVEPHDSESMIRYLIRLKSDPTLASELGRSGRERIEQHFSQEYIFGRLDDTYQEMLTAGLKRDSSK